LKDLRLGSCKDVWELDEWWDGVSLANLCVWPL